MTNRILRDKQVPHNAEAPDEVETNFTRQQDALEASATDENRTRIATSGNAYPKLPETSPWAAPADHGFSPARDRIDPSDECSMTFGIALGGQSTPPLEAPSANSAPQPNPEPIDRDGASSFPEEDEE